MPSHLIERGLSFAVLVAVLSAVMWLDARVGDRAAVMARSMIGRSHEVSAFGADMVTQVIDSFTGRSSTLLPAFVTVAFVLLVSMMQGRKL